MNLKSKLREIQANKPKNPDNNIRLVYSSKKKLITRSLSCKKCDLIDWNFWRPL